MLFRHAGVVRILMALTLAVFLNLIAIGCGLPIKPLDGRQKAGPELLEVGSIDLLGQYPQFELLEATSQQLTLLVLDVKSNAYTLEVNIGDIIKRPSQLMVKINGELALIDLSTGKEEHQESTKTEQLQPEGLVAVIFAVYTAATFIRECATPAWQAYKKRITWDRALEDCLIWGVSEAAGYIAGKVAGKAAKPAIERAIRSKVGFISKETLQQAAGESIDGIIGSLISKIFSRVLNAIKQALDELRISYVVDPRAPQITSVGYPGALRANTVFTVIIQFYDPEGNIVGASVTRREGMTGLSRSWKLMDVRTQAFGREAGQIKFPERCDAPRMFSSYQITLEIRLSDLHGLSSQPFVARYQCTR